MSALAKLLVSGFLYYSGLLALIALCFPRRHPVILYAHRVVDRDDPFFPGIPERTFAAHVAYLARHHRVLPLEAVVEGLLRERPLPRGSVAITFDDGFADNFTLAYPVLQRYRVPATVFLIAVSVETGRLPWPERLAYVLQRTKGTRLEMGLPEQREFLLETQAQRLAALATVLTLLKNYDTEERRHVMREIEAVLSVRREPREMLTWDQCRIMAQSGVSFGAHTLSHPILPKTDSVEIKREICDSKAVIEQKLNCEVRYFGYPDGSACPEAVEAVRAAGFEAAFVGEAWVEGPVDRFAIGRTPHDSQPVCVFAAEMTGTLDSLRSLRRRLACVFGAMRAGDGE